MKYLLAIGTIAVAAFLLWPRNTPPTADELYGCTVAQQAPNGECK